jgi:hypothetical protein
MAGSAYRKPTFKLDSLTFSGDFDSGRLGSVRKNGDVYEVSLPNDCEELHIKNEYRVWYFFSISGGTPGSTIICKIMNLHQIAKVYNTDLRPLVRVCSKSPVWERLHEPCDFSVKSNLDLQLTFQYTFVASAPVFFAFYYPFSYSDCQRLLENIDRALPSIGATTGKLDNPAGRGGGEAAPAHHVIYYHREFLVQTTDGRRVELLTITSRSGIMTEREPYIEGAGLFPRGASEPRPHRFKGKPGIFISARVHPGETAASYMVHGLIAFLLQPRNPYAQALRAAFVFKIVPMLNPDGVARGHFRLDQFGANLNRCYLSPSPKYQPSIFAVRAVLRQVSLLCACVSLPEAGRGPRALHQTSNGLFMYLDLHAYSAKQGCYLLGNDMTPYKESRIYTFSHLMQLYSPQFNAFACSFGAMRKRKAADGCPQPKNSVIAEEARKRMRITEELAMQMLYGGPLPTSALPPVIPFRSLTLSEKLVAPRVVKHSYMRPHVHAAEASALALMAAALTHQSTLAVCASPAVDLLDSAPMAPRDDAGSATDAMSDNGSDAPSTAPGSCDDSADAFASVVVDAVRDREEGVVEEDADADKDADSVSTTSEAESENSEEDDATILPRIKLSDAEMWEMLRVATRIFGLPESAASASTWKDEPIKPKRLLPYSSIGLSVLPSRQARVVDTMMRHVVILPDGARSGPADAMLHDNECRRLTKEWQAMKAKTNAGGSSADLKSKSAPGAIGELKKGGTGRVRAYKDLFCVHSYTVECSCNLLPHATAIHRQTMFEDESIDPATFPMQARAAQISAAPTIEPPAVVALYNEYARVFEQAYATPYEERHAESGRVPADSHKYIRICCPQAVKRFQSQIDPRPVTSTEDPRSSHSKPMAYPYMCQVDSLQPPIGVLAHAGKASGARPASSAGVSTSSSHFITPFGISMLGPTTSPLTCAWGSCPNDPPAVFACVGRSVAFALLDLIGASVARESGGSSIHVPPPGFHSLQSRLTGTMWKNVAGLHRWSRILLEAEQIRPEELMASSGYLAALDAPKRTLRPVRTSSSSSGAAEQARGGLPISLLVTPPSQNVDVVVFPRPTDEALSLPELSHFLAEPVKEAANVSTATQMVAAPVAPVVDRATSHLLTRQVPPLADRPIIKRIAEVSQASHARSTPLAPTTFDLSLDRLQAGGKAIVAGFASARGMDSKAFPRKSVVSSEGTAPPPRRTSSWSGGLAAGADPTLAVARLHRHHDGARAPLVGSAAREASSSEGIPSKPYRKTSSLSSDRP